MYDFSQSEPAKSDFELIPAKTIAPVIVTVRAGEVGTPENAFSVSKSGLLQLSLEFTITEGPFAKRKIFQRLIMGASEGVEMTEGQAKAVAIAGSLVRSMLEAGRGVSPTDESAAAIEARKMRSIFELDNLEMTVEIGVDKDKTGAYSDKNKVARVVPVAAKGGAVAPKAAPISAATAKAAPATAKKAAWS